MTANTGTANTGQRESIVALQRLMRSLSAEYLDALQAMRGKATGGFGRKKLEQVDRPLLDVARFTDAQTFTDRGDDRFTLLAHMTRDGQVDWLETELLLDIGLAALSADSFVRSVSGTPANDPARQAAEMHCEMMTVRALHLDHWLGQLVLNIDERIFSRVQAGESAAAERAGSIASATKRTLAAAYQKIEPNIRLHDRTRQFLQHAEITPLPLCVGKDRKDAKDINGVLLPIEMAEVYLKKMARDNAAGMAQATRRAV